MAQDLRAFLVSQAATIEAAVYEARYPSIQYPMLAPVITEGNQWALSVERRTSDGGGTAGDIAHLSDDFPNVDVQYQRLTQEAHGFGSSYTIGEDEAAIAMMGGFNIADDKARTARRIVEERLDKVFRDGDSTRNWDQFASPPSGTGQAGATAVTPTGGAGQWDNTAKTAAQITTDVSAAITAVYNRTNQIYLPDTLAVPTKAFAALASKQVANTTMTAAEWVRQNNVYTATTGTPLNIVAVHTLTTAGLVYQRDPDVLRFYLPMPATVRGPQLERAGMSMTYYVMARTGGLEWRIPGAAQRITGLAAA